MFDTTVEALIERVKRDVSLGSRGPVFTLASQHAQGATTVHVNETPEFGGTGSVLSMSTSSYYVQSADTVAKTFTVIPGYHGTEDETHDPPMVVYMDDLFPGGAIKDHAIKEIMSWRSHLWRVRTKDLTVGPTQMTYDLDLGTDEIIYLLDVRRQPTGSTSWAGFEWNNDRWPRVPSRLMRNADPVTFPSGLALRLKHHVPPTQLRIAYATKFVLDPFTAATDLVADVGLQEDWIDILEAGIRRRALAGHVVSRADWRTGGHVRNAEEVSVMDVVRATTEARNEALIGLSAAAAVLRGQWPYRSG